MGETMATRAPLRALGALPFDFGRRVLLGDKSLKIFMFLSFFGISSGLLGCGAASQRRLESQMIADLETENARLQTEVTTLQEQKLEAERSACLKRPDREPESSPRAVPAPRPTLPVVRMAPEDQAEERPVGESDEAVVSIRPASPEDQEEEAAPSGTRPVLKVRGQHEAWVYHRPIEEGESEAPPLPLDPASGGAPAGDR